MQEVILAKYELSMLGLRPLLHLDATFSAEQK
jgi:hypothetical protein